MFFRNFDFIDPTNNRLISSRCWFVPLAITFHFARRPGRDMLGLPEPSEHPSADEPLIAEIDGGRPATMFINRDRRESRVRIASFFSKRSWLIQG
jgi:hypothetical protein